MDTDLRSTQSKRNRILLHLLQNIREKKMGIQRVPLKVKSSTLKT